MKNNIGTINDRAKLWLGRLAFAMGFVLLVTGVLRGTLGEPNYETILYFEQENPVYEVSVDAGTAREELGLPSSLRAVFNLIAEETTVESTEAEIIEEATEDGTTDEAAEDGTTDVTTEEETTEEITEEETTEEAITETVREVPVTWQGKYDGDTPGTYTLTAKVEGYDYSGEMPTAVITVKPVEEAADGDNVTVTAPTEVTTPAPTEVTTPAPTEVTTPAPTEKTTESDNFTGNMPTAVITPDPTKKPGVSYNGNPPPMNAPAEIAPANAALLSDIWNTNSPANRITIDGVSWFVTNKTTAPSGKRYAMLLAYTSFSGSFSKTSSPNTDYRVSQLRDNITYYYSICPTIKAMAVVPSLSLSSTTSTSVTSNYTETPAGSQTADIAFALSHKDWSNLGSAYWSKYPAISNNHLWTRTAWDSQNVYVVNTNGSSISVFAYAGQPIAHREVYGVWVCVSETEHTVTEKHVDIYGNQINGWGDTSTQVTSGNPYSKAIPNISGYIIKGFKPDSFSNALDPNTTASIPSVTSDRTVYFVYDPLTTLTVSKAVSGNYASKNAEFTFTAYFYADSAGTMPLASMGGGSMTFKLKHGQNKTIQDVPQSCYIKIAEAPQGSYKTSFKDNGGADSNVNIDVKDTGIRPMSASRVFDFTNAMPEPVPAGIDSGGTETTFLLPALALLLVLAAFAGKAALRRRKRT